MIHHRMDIRREDRLCVIVDRDSRVCPPEESLRCGSPVIELAFDLDIGFSRIEGKACLAFCSVHLIDVADTACL